MGTNKSKNKNTNTKVTKQSTAESVAGAEKFYDENGNLRRDNRFFVVGLLVFFAGLFIDLLTKALAEIYFGVFGHAVVEVIPGLLNLTLIYNTGAAFGSFSDNPVLMNVITWLTPVVVILFLVFAWRLPKIFNPHRFFLCLAASGAFGNFLDRVFVADGVRDFMDISSIGFGVCNFADYFSTIGLILLVLCILFVGDEALFPIIGRKRRTGGKEQDEGRKKKQK